MNYCKQQHLKTHQQLPSSHLRGDQKTNSCNKIPEEKNGGKK
jgi:hypothetical protein